MDRRKFLQTAGIVSGTVFMGSCGSERDQNKLISYLVPPEDGVTPGKALWYATTCTECTAGCGAMVRVREGRPVKIEGIPEHPVSRGGLCMRGQSSLWRLYHPERIKTPLLRQEGGFLEISWEEALGRIRENLDVARSEGRRSVYLAGRTTGSLSEMIDLFGETAGVERLPEFEYFSHAALRRSYGALFGREEIPHFPIDEADVLLTVGADLLETFLSPVDFAARYSEAVSRENFRWFHAEPHMSLTGANAHRRLILKPGGEAALLAHLLRTSASGGRKPPRAVLDSLPELSPQDAADATGLGEKSLRELTEAWAGAKRPMVIAGGVSVGQRGGEAVSLLAGLLQGMHGWADFSRAENYGNVGNANDLAKLSDRLATGGIGVIFISRTNPVYHAPDDLHLSARLRQPDLAVGFADLPDETTRELDLILPVSHTYESWGDTEPRRGIRTLIRPAVQPLYDTRSEGGILLELAGKGESYRDWLFSRWSGRFGEKALGEFASRGYLVEEAPGEKAQFDPADAIDVLKRIDFAQTAGPGLWITPSIRAFDGRSRPLKLLSEVPDPLTTISYGRWVSVPEADAKRLKIRDGEEVRLSSGDWSVELPARIQPGLLKGRFTVHREHLHRAPFGIDPDTGEFIVRLDGPRVEKTGVKRPLAVLAGSTSRQGRGIIPDPVHREAKKEEVHARLYPEHEHPEYRWAMAVDLRRCIGCGACAAACYVENNVPVTGQKDHLKGREMSWLRIEPYYRDDGAVEFVPMLCQHCHFAPCEPVCPVYAAYHNPQGLNVQVYNRCVGTRYCSNNCPYKVRRFNWWPHKAEEPLRRMHNPDVPVRARGVMEKCTFCIQRIRAAGDAAKDEGRKIRDGEVMPACAQSCPTSAIVFGNLKDLEAKVTRLSKADRAYRIFDVLGTESSVYYLKGQE